MALRDKGSEQILRDLESPEAVILREKSKGTSRKMVSAKLRLHGADPARIETLLNVYYPPQVESQAELEQPASGIAPALIGGLIVAAIAGLIWGWISTHYAPTGTGYIAGWVIGYVTAWAIHLFSGRQKGGAYLVAAAVMSVLGVVIGVVFQFVLLLEMTKQGAPTTLPSNAVNVPFMSALITFLIKSGVVSDLIWGGLISLMAAWSVMRDKTPKGEKIDPREDKGGLQKKYDPETMLEELMKQHRNTD